MKGATAGAPPGFPCGIRGSTETPTISSPRLRYFSCRVTNPGISILQGPHQVAQKSRITIFPLYASRLSLTFAVTSGVPLTGMFRFPSSTQPDKATATTNAIAAIYTRLFPGKKCAFLLDMECSPGTVLYAPLAERDSRA